jgi:hypothetical protein
VSTIRSINVSINTSAAVVVMESSLVDGVKTGEREQSPYPVRGMGEVGGGSGCGPGLVGGGSGNGSGRGVGGGGSSGCGNGSGGSCRVGFIELEPMHD